ncbi:MULTISPECIES: hypothetical protein [unclassified Pseudomonas]|uniref:hypothetical protein n=1 Tax=unclassified Pseudomonas TaxID=196821 RepID=UPI00147605E8|nr:MULTISPECIES: hypothetical protein [unclassified Pseudomonas]MBK3455609.1 hypothetical protein [Pseudomonas sp. MF6754]NMX34643.1 hypothetical protein [Pseudomonas sp. WS 5413]
MQRVETANRPQIGRHFRRLILADSVEKVGFSDRLNSGTTTTGEPTHHIEWFFGPSVTFAALLLG